MITLRIFLQSKKFMFIVMNVVIYHVITSFSACEYKLYNLREIVQEHNMNVIMSLFMFYKQNIYPPTYTNTTRQSQRGLRGELKFASNTYKVYEL